MSIENPIFIEQLGWLDKIKEQVQRDSLPIAALRAYQRAFVSTLREQLVLSDLDSVVLERLVIVSSSDPVSTGKLTRFVGKRLCRDEKDTVEVRGEVIDSISRLNTALPEVTGLKIRRSTKDQDQEDRWFLSPYLRFVLKEKEGLEILNLVAAGYNRAEITGKTKITTGILSRTLDGLYKQLRVEGALGAALLLAEDGLLDMRVFAQRVDRTRFDFLTQRQLEVLEALIGGHETNDSIARHLKISTQTVKNHISCIEMFLGITGIINRVGVGVGYWLYKQGETEEKNSPR